MRASSDQTAVTSFSSTLYVLSVNSPERALKPSSCLRQLTTINSQKNRNGGKQQQRKAKELHAVVMYLEKEIQRVVIAPSNTWTSPRSDRTQGLSLAPFICTISLLPLQTRCLLAAGKICYGVSLIKIFFHLQYEFGKSLAQTPHFNGA